MKKYKLKKWVKVVLVILVLVIVAPMLVKLNNKLNDEAERAINYCTNQGYSYVSCYYGYYGK